MITAALYARVSTDRQEKQATINSQIEEVEQSIKKDGNILADKFKFIDDGWSGSILARPALDNLRDAAREKKFECLYVYDRDRISRSYVHQGVILEELEKKVQVIVLHDPEIKSPEDKAMLQMKGVFSEYERVKIAERTRRGKLSKARNGYIVHGPGPYGYRYVLKSATKQGYYLVDQYEAGTVRKMFKWVGEEGLTINGVIKRLQETGIQPRKSSKGLWSSSTLSKLFRCEAYIGNAYYNKTVAIEPERPQSERKYKKIVKTSRRLKERKDWIKIPVPVIIEEELFNKAQNQLKRNSWFSDRCQKHEYQLTGLLFCSCGSRMWVVSSISV